MAKTLIERYGFVDPDRNILKHDEIQLWVYNNFFEVVNKSMNIENLTIQSKIPLELEYIIKDNNIVVGFIDIYSPHLNIGIEVKTEIPVVGDLLRQMKFYRNYCLHTEWIIVSPDARCEQILKDQKLYFYKYKRQGELFS